MSILSSLKVVPDTQKPINTETHRDLALRASVKNTQHTQANGFPFIFLYGQFLRVFLSVCVSGTTLRDDKILIRKLEVC